MRIKSADPRFCLEYSKIDNSFQMYEEMPRLKKFHSMHQGDGVRRPINIAKKIVHFEFSMKHKIRILISDPELTIGWLFCECTRKLMEYTQSHPKLMLDFKIEDF